MEPLNVILKRFIQWLPFLTNPFGYRRFHFELFYRYPDIWNDREIASGGVLTPPIRTDQVAPQEPVSPTADLSKAPRSRRGPESLRGSGLRARSYLSWMELHHFGPHGGEPFW